MKKRMICFSLLLLWFGAVQAQNTEDIKMIQHYENLINHSPDKSEFYDTLGMLYYVFSEEELNAGNKEKAQDCYLQAEKYFLTSLEKNAKGFSANFSLGLIYYNDALSLTNELLEEDLDFSTAGRAKYELQKKKEKELWEKALPFFKKAESVNPNDIQNLYALIGIFGQLEEEDLLVTFKARLKVIQDGGEHDAAFFKE